MALVFFSSRRRHTRFDCDWSSDVCSSDLTDQRAFQVSPRKSILLAISPSLRSDHDTIENWLSKIHQKAIAESTVGTMNGISTRARTIALKGMLWLSSSAR